MIFATPPYLLTPYKPLTGALTKTDTILARCAEHPERFLVSPLSGDPRALVARALTAPENAVWEVWRTEPGSAIFVGVVLLDRIVAAIDARLQFVFFDDELASKAPLLNEFVRRCFAEFGLHRLTFEAPENMTVLIGFAKRKLGFDLEGRRERAYFDGARWHAIVTMRRFGEERI